MKNTTALLARILIMLALSSGLQAQSLNPQAQQKVDRIIAEVRDWAKSAPVTKAVEDQNRELPPALATMTQQKWDSLPEADPFVHAFTVNAAAEFLRRIKTPAISEMFLSDANGRKIAFLAKTTNWSHQGKPKHEVPMSGRVWQGKIEVDQSTGSQELQISVPVLVDGKAAGSLVVGIAVSALMSD